MNSAEFVAETDRVNEAEWAGLLGLFADANPYQTWSYGAVRWGAKNLSHLVLRRGGEVAAIAQIRIVRAGFLNRGIAYLRWGPVCQRRGQELDGETTRAMAEALKAEYAAKRRLFLRILPDAFEGSPRGEVFRAAFAELQKPAVSTGADRTIVLNLEPSLEQLRKGLDQKWRNQLNRAEKNNLTLLEGRSAEHYAMFLKLYREMWNRKKFDTTVDVEEFGRIQEALPEELKFRILICRDKDVAVSSLVCSAMGQMGIYLLGATSEAGLNSKGAYLMQWNMIKWLKENGCKQYDLGGINPDLNPGVYHFKKGFSGEDVTRLGQFDYCEDVLSYLTMKGADLTRGGFSGLFKKQAAVLSPATSDGDLSPAAGKAAKVEAGN